MVSMEGIVANAIPWLIVIAQTIGGLVLVSSMGFVTLLIKKNKQFKDTVIIVRRLKPNAVGVSGLEKDEDVPFIVENITKGGTFNDKKLKKKVYKIKGYSANFDPNYEEFVPKNGSGDLIFYERVSDKSFVPLKPELIGKKIGMTVTSEDISWGINEFNANVRMAGKGFWEQWGGMISIAIMFVVAISIIALLLNKFEVLSDVSNSLERVATTLAQAKTNTVVSAAPA